jgi:hypothetical protein
METLYNEAIKADAAFQAAVVAQFGEKNAGTMRYKRSLFNLATLAAADAFAVATAAFLDAKGGL